MINIGQYPNGEIQRTFHCIKKRSRRFIGRCIEARKEVPASFKSVEVLMFQ